MVLSDALLRAAVSLPHVLTVTEPGGTALRVGIERELRRRGWPAAASPADADLLAIAGEPNEGLAEVVATTWAAMPAPRARLRVRRVEDLAALLDGGRRDLGDRRTQQATAAAERTPTVMAAHRGMEDQAGDGGGGMEGMEMPGGLSMADRGPDRDGLKLDQLHVALGPVLPDWPSRLVLHVTLQGDVVQECAVEVLGGPGSGSFWDEPWRAHAAGRAVKAGEAARRRVAAHLDSLARLLAVAGWEDAAAASRQLRDQALDGAPAASLAVAVRRLASRVDRSVTLRWLTRGLGVLRAEDAAAAGVRGPAGRAAGDVTARCRRWCVELAELGSRLSDDAPLDPLTLEPPRGALGGNSSPSSALLAVLPSLLQGAELGAARLIVASLDPDLDEAGALPRGTDSRPRSTDSRPRGGPHGH